jgi:ribosome maturation factor RimP
VANEKKNIASTVWDLIQPTVNDLGCSLWDVEYLKEGSKYILRITIDKESGVDINDCEAVHRAIDPILDEADPITVPYYLEVSSPGIERELRLPFHFEVCMDHVIDVKLFTSFEGKKQFNGKLNGYDHENGTITVDETTIPLDKISRINLHYDFED